MKTNKLLLPGFVLSGFILLSGCSNNQKEEKKLDTIYENTDTDGHPLDNRDTIVEYKTVDSLTKDTSLRGDKH